MAEEPKRETPLNISLSKEVKNKLKAFAAGRGMSTSELFRVALQKYLDEEGVDINVSYGLESWGRKSEKE
jgi:hypothetical protein